MPSDLRIKFSRAQGWNFDGSPHGEKSVEPTEIEVSPTSTFGEAWDALAAKFPDLETHSPGGFSWGDGVGETGYFFDYVGADGQLNWGQPWYQLRFADLDHLYPQPVIDWQTNTFTFIDHPQIGQDYDLSWHDFIHFYQAIRPFVEDGLLWIGAAVAAKHGVDAARRRAKTFGNVLKGRTERWQRRGGHPYEVRDVIENNELPDQEKVELLGLEDDMELDILERLLDPEEEDLKRLNREGLGGYSTESLRRLRRSAALVGRPAIRHYECACDYVECPVQAAWVDTARGLKLGLTDLSDHFIFPASSLEEARRQIERASERESRLADALSDEEAGPTA